MHPKCPRWILGAACMAAAVTPIPGASQVRVQRLDRAEASFPEPFTSVAGLRELSDGRILIADRTEKHVSFIDFATGSMREIGRVGEGPGEYQSPGGLVALPDDYTLLLDLANLRLTRIAPDGKLEMESWPMLSPNGLIRPSAADAQGRLFYSASGGMRIALGGGAAATPPDSLRLSQRCTAGGRHGSQGVRDQPRRQSSDHHVRYFCPRHVKHVRPRPRGPGRQLENGAL